MRCGELWESYAAQKQVLFKEEIALSKVKWTHPKRDEEKEIHSQQRYLAQFAHD